MNVDIELELHRLGARLRRRREELQLSMADVARRSGFDEQTILRLETGLGARLRTLLCVMHVLEVKVKLRQRRAPSGGPHFPGADSNDSTALRA